MHVFSAMQKRDQITSAILGIVFILSLGQFFVSKMSLPVRSEKGVFSEGIIGKIKILNPVFADFNETDRDVSQLIFSGLMRYDPVQKNFFPDIAESWERDSKGITYTFRLKPNILWHDGKPLTSADINFTFHDVIQDSGFKNYLLKEAFQGVSIETPDPVTVIFTLPKANSYFVSNLTIGVLPKHALENVSVATLEKSSFSQRPIGSGPYKLTGLRLNSDGDTVDLQSFPQYYGERPKVERIRFYTFPNEKKLLKEKSALFGIAKLPSNGTAAKSIAEDSRFKIYPYTLNQFTALYFNTEAPFVNEKTVRRVLLRGIDKNNLVLEGEQRVDAIDLKSYPNSKEFETDTKLAESVLDDIGLKRGSDGLRSNTKGDTFTLEILTNQKISPEIALRLQSAWTAFGIKVNITAADGTEFTKLVGQRRYSALLIRQNLGYNRDVYPLFHSSQGGAAEQNSGLNFSNFKSFATDALTEAIRKEKDPSSKEKLLKELSGTLIRETPIIFISTPVYYYALDTRVSPFNTDVLGLHADRMRFTPYLIVNNL